MTTGLTYHLYLDFAGRIVVVAGRLNSGEWLSPWTPVTYRTAERFALAADYDTLHIHPYGGSHNV